MKTKNYHCQAMVAIAACLMIFFTTAIPGRVMADDPPVKKFHADEIYVSANTTQRDIYTYECGLLMIEQRQSLTEGVWTTTRLTEYTYDANGWLQNKFITPVGTRESLYTYTYDVDGKMLTELFQRKLITATVWEDYEIRYFTYDENDYLIQELKQRVVSGSWRNNMLTTNTYDPNGNMLTQLTQSWNISSTTWTNSQLKIMTYDANNNQISLMSQIYMGGTWINQTINIKTYDENGNLMTQLVQSGLGGQWNNALFNNFIRGLDGNLLLHTMERWVSEAWENYLKTVYDSQPGFISGQSYTWDVTLEDWVIGGMGLVQLALVLDGNETLFGTASGYASVNYSQELYVEPSPYQTVYLGYPPAECVEVSATVSGGTPPYTYAWDNGETGESFLACPEESTAYTVLVTDAEGCTFEASTRVCVIDVRCGKNLDKVAICHCPPGNPNNCKTLCISVADVAEHLAHGDLLGPCGTDHSCNDFKTALAAAIYTEYDVDIFLQAYPNPFEKSTTISYRVSVPGNVTIRLVNATGQQVRKLYEGYSADGELLHLQINMEHLQPGMYLCILEQADGSMVSHKLVLRQ
jgi:hypothetical protein